ncbi:E3 ubiquitin-protein ligase RFI2-like isoform X1 [Telopea speciosissima]|uniref:E3 ubiquitin-protein ligase RFI2-like isoform X1 n=1 Tax=Telopea speciosissima TaxID=54955 RepID=UPI001CC36B78|nr:E3 ubiquitin-protein ligase RFI2-like isoform X1 [Telopea speciosissima]
MGTGDADPFDDEGGGGLFLSSSSVSCSICLELVKDNGDRSRAKLQCGHEFHLDCIGSAFNAKGVMQCPNCRKIEKGQWLYANGCRSFPDFGMEDFTHDEDLYDLSYSEMPFGVHWCPFSGFSRVHSSFEEGESPSTTYHDLLGHHAIFAEHTAAPSAAHSCPYVAYFQPLQPSSSTSNESLADGPNFNHHWNSLSGPSDISSTSHAFPAVDLHYHSWDHHSPLSPTNGRIGGADQAPLPSATMRSNRGDSDGIPRPGSFVHPFLLGHGSGPRAGSSVVSSMVPPYPGSSARTHDRIQGLHAYHQQQQPNNSPGMRSPMFSAMRRTSGPRGLAPVGPVASSSDHAGAFYVFPPSGSSGRSLQEAENPVRGRFYAWERDRFAPFPLIPVDRESSWWGPFPQAAGGSDSGSRAGGFWQRHGSERTSSQSRLESSSYQPVHPSGRMLPFL